jgi:hypothetical protein
VRGSPAAVVSSCPLTVAWSIRVCPACGTVGWKGDTNNRDGLAAKGRESCHGLGHRQFGMCCGW